MASRLLRSATPAGPTIAPAGSTRFASKPGCGAAKVRVTVSSSTTVDLGDLLLAALGEAAVGRQVGVAAEVEVLLDELGRHRRAVGEGRARVEVERELGLLLVVLEVRDEVGDDLALLVEDEERVVDALEEHPLAAAVAQRVVAERGLVGVEADDEDRGVGGLAAAASAVAAGPGAGAERES